MINIIAGLVTALIYLFAADNPTATTALILGLFSASYVMFFRYSLTLYFVMSIISKNPKLESDLKSAITRSVRNET